MKLHDIALIFLAILAAAPAMAQTKYVEDRLEITMRNGTTTRNAIVKMLKSGSSVEVLEEDSETGYTRVRSGETEGWVLTRFLMDEPAGREQLRLAQQRLDRLRNQFENTNAGAATLEQENADLRSQTRDLEAQNERLSKELADLQAKSSNVLVIDRENTKLKTDLTETRSQLDSVSDENQVLRDRRWENGIILGAAILLTGFLLGFILPRIRFKRKSSWGSL